MMVPRNRTLAVPWRCNYYGGFDSYHRQLFVRHPSTAITTRRTARSARLRRSTVISTRPRPQPGHGPRSMDCCVMMRNAVNLRGREDAPTGPEQSGRLLGFQEGQDWADHCIPTFRATPPGRERLVTRRRALYARAADLCLLLTLHGSSDVWSGGAFGTCLPCATFGAPSVGARRRALVDVAGRQGRSHPATRGRRA